MQHSGQEVKVNFFDMSGDVSYYDVRNEFYADTQCAILVFDVTNPASFADLERWISEMAQNVRKQ